MPEKSQRTQVVIPQKEYRKGLKQIISRLYYPDIVYDDSDDKKSRVERDAAKMTLQEFQSKYSTAEQEVLHKTVEAQMKKQQARANRLYPKNATVNNLMHPPAVIESRVKKVKPTNTIIGLIADKEHQVAKVSGKQVIRALNRDEYPYVYSDKHTQKRAKSLSPAASRMLKSLK